MMVNIRINSILGADFTILNRIFLEQGQNELL